MSLRLTFSLFTAALLAVAATALVLKTDTAIAQQAAEELDEIVVEAPIVRRTVTRGALGSKIEDIELSRRVSYADLDLSKHVDVIELETRIQTTAKKSCKKLSDMFPLSPSDSREIQRCTNRAVDGTEEQVRAAIAAAS